MRMLFTIYLLVGVMLLSGKCFVTRLKLFFPKVIIVIDLQYCYGVTKNIQIKQMLAFSELYKSK